MKKLIVMLMIGTLSVVARASEDPNLIKKLSDAKFSLKDAVEFAEKTSGPATSAKFELDDSGALVFSVYTAPQGLNTPAELTQLTELSGSATVSPIVAQAEVFSDREHIARASTHLTLMQLSRRSLMDMIALALSKEPGMAYSVKNPSVKDHRAVADVSILTSYGDIETVSVDMMTGKILK